MSHEHEYEADDPLITVNDGRLTVQTELGVAIPTQCKHGESLQAHRSATFPQRDLPMPQGFLYGIEEYDLMNLYEAS